MTAPSSLGGEGEQDPETARDRGRIRLGRLASESGRNPDELEQAWQRSLGGDW